MNFDSKDTEEYLYKKLKLYGEVHISPRADMIWTREKVDNFVNNLKKVYKLYNMNVTQ